MKKYIFILAVILLICTVTMICGCNRVVDTKDEPDNDSSEPTPDTTPNTDADTELDNNTSTTDSTLDDASSNDITVSTPNNTPEADVEKEHIHDFSDATCTTPKTCRSCGETEGEKLEHIITCLDAGTCAKCGEKLQEQGLHNYSAKLTTDKYISAAPTLETPATYYYSCIYCGSPDSNIFYHGETLQEIIIEPYNKLSQGNIDGEYYMFFTDPHIVNFELNAGILEGGEEKLDALSEIYKSGQMQFAICGGDWFNSSNNKESAIEIQKWIRSKMTEKFGEKSYLVVGNHDYNYQYHTGTENITSPYWLTKEELAPVLFPDYGKTYYSFLSDASRFYVFDSGLDWGHYKVLTDLDKEQIVWYLEQLTQNDDKHIVLVPHMVAIANTGALHEATIKFAEISAVYNARGTYEYNGKTYDFSAKTGMVEYIIAGHLHVDTEGELSGIPYITTATTKGAPLADLIFANYTERKVYIKRYGNGTNREIQLKPINNETE